MELETNKNRMNRNDEAYDKIKEMIISGKLEQGEVVSIMAMSEALGMSRTPVTNACHRLEAHDFLKIIPKQGVIINTITIQDAREYYELRAAIETFSAKNAFSNINAEDIQYLQDSLSKQKTILEDQNLYEFMNEDTKFHRYLLNKNHNSQFISLFEILCEKGMMIGMKVHQNMNRSLQALAQHQELIDALNKGKKQDFVDGIENHIMDGYRSLTGAY